MMRRGFWRRGVKHFTDEQLVQAFQQTGKEAYFDELFERYHPLVYGLCLNITAKREDSKDLTLIAFQKAYEALPHTSLERFDHWLFTLSRNACFYFLREENKNKKALRSWQQEQGGATSFMLNEAFRPALYEEDLLQDKLLKEGLSQLSEEQQKCLQLFLYEFKSYQEIARSTGYSLAQTKSHLQNGRLKLKRWIKQQQDSK